ncbi:MAG TPA: ABC transporter ATP-binding protein [Beijerinckiaceae bacterium]|nr:ABC transporter ATP-binding protein [Beijerinckiaceae bacterium]
MSFLELQSVAKSYGAVTALDGVDLTVAAGRRTAVVGPSGSGKTTLLRVIAGFERPDAGRVTLDGRCLADEAHVMPAHRRNIGIVAQDGALFPHLCIADNIGFGLDRATKERRRVIAHLMEMVGLDASMALRRPDELSGGQQQRVALARALARKPRLMLLDEPFSALDTGLRASTRKAVSDLLSAAGITTVLVTHDQAEALSFADQVAVMRDGKLLQVGTPRELYLRPKDPMVAAFLGDAVVLPAQVVDGWADCVLGRIGVDDRECRGAAQIMLRPEQISLEQISANNSHDTETIGEVVDVDFCGAVCTVALRLRQASESTGAVANGFGASDAPLILRQSTVEALTPGTMVRISIIGAAHVFAA